MKIIVLRLVYNLKQYSTIMWEKDKQLLKKYRDCMAAFLEEVNSGEEVDYSEACAEESAKLSLYIAGQLGNY